MYRQEYIDDDGKYVQQTNLKFYPLLKNSLIASISLSLNIAHYFSFPLYVFAFKYNPVKKLSFLSLSIIVLLFYFHKSFPIHSLSADMSVT